MLKISQEQLMFYMITTGYESDDQDGFSWYYVCWCQVCEREIFGHNQVFYILYWIIDASIVWIFSKLHNAA